MKNNITKLDRLRFKTVESRITNYFESRYNFSPVISESLTADTLFFKTVFGNNQRLDGQIIYYAVSNKEPAGKPLKDCQYVKHILTLHDKNDADYREKHGLKNLKLRIIKLYLSGLLTKEISEKTNHHPFNVDNYISSFEQVRGLYEEDKSVQQITFFTGFSQGLVKEYIQIIKELNQLKNSNKPNGPMSLTS